MTEFPDLVRRFIAGSYHQILGSRILTSAPILELKIIFKRCLALQALDKVDCDVRVGEIDGLVGENGAGKSTLMRILSGVYAKYDGEYILDEQPVHFRSPREARDRGIAMIHQELSVMPQLSVAENLFLGQQPRTRWRTVNWEKMNAVARQELARLGFDNIDVQQPLERYSLGTHQVAEALPPILPALPLPGGGDARRGGVCGVGRGA